jgi:hypothetical protein
MIMNRMKFPSCLLCSVLAGALAFVSQGCGGSATQSAQQALDRQYKDNPQLQRPNLAKFAGTVTVDGQPPAKGTVIVVILNDPKKPAPRNKPSQYAIADPEGHFEFSTSLKGDGTLPGSYVVTFAELHPHGRRGFFPPDELKNLYNDPDKNAGKNEFQLDLKPPGKTDFTMDLKVAGEEVVSTPGANSTTEIR